ncbi:60S ribosome subunit biogenesis protein NIP7 homolog [Haematococcus lacustris]|uniref:60S ribosome subunit biogenesis protein NIP7 homolog n=1 Tax=Haematococcus lacustris TaxID=44745 RepID=A0A699ZBK9_HAELA|nr:60S ribosome subunit biogenesis protein NIP7 homolog [Haematococcus lacustris]
MRPLTEDETKLVFEKLFKFIGKNIKSLVDRPDEPHCFRLQKNRVYYVRESLMKKATNVSPRKRRSCYTPLCFKPHWLLSLQIARDKLVHLGTCIGKLTHTGKFRLAIGALDILSQHAKYKIWVKPSVEMQFLYGNHILKGGLGRITESTPTYTGAVVYSMSDLPLGFGVTAKSTDECRTVDPGAIVAFHQADVGGWPVSIGHVTEWHPATLLICLQGMLTSAGHVPVPPWPCDYITADDNDVHGAHYLLTEAFDL